ncbi:MAG: transposase [Treponema sp.]|nr:transposase [Treponema sp.]
MPVKRERGRKTDTAALRQAVADRPEALLKEYAEPCGSTAPAVFYALKKRDKGYPSEHRKRTGAVNGGGLVEIQRNILQTGKEKDHQVSRFLPHIHH